MVCKTLAAHSLFKAFSDSFLDFFCRQLNRPRSSDLPPNNIAPRQLQHYHNSTLSAICLVKMNLLQSHYSPMSSVVADVQTGLGHKEFNPYRGGESPSEAMATPGDQGGVFRI
jgi:hypothetical protein